MIPARCLCFVIAVAGGESVASGSGGAGTVPSEAARTKVAAAIAIAVLAGALVLLVFLVASYALIRSARRFRQAAGRDRPSPTLSDDVWAQHKLPEDWDTEDDDDRDDGSPVY